MSQRFTIDGSDELESNLAALCNKIVETLLAIIPEHRVEAIVLGGGYGRGQGGVLRTANGDRPYNDLEFYVFLKGPRILNERSYAQALAQVGEDLSPEARLHVEFKIDSLRAFERAPVSMFSYDLASRHRIVFGDKLALKYCVHHREASAIPASEATRLLFNRCSGLLLAREMLQQPKLENEDCDFIGRNLAKAKLALGDVVLTVFGQYHWSCLERCDRLARLEFEDAPPEWQQIRKHHSEGVEFKLHPRQIKKSKAEFQREHGELCGTALQLWLWLESRRLRRQFATVDEYAFSGFKNCRGPGFCRNLLLSLQTFGPGAVFDSLAMRYPRERLLSALPVLLWNAEVTPGVRRHVQRQLRSVASDWSGLVAAYKQIWPRYG